MGPRLELFGGDDLGGLRKPFVYPCLPGWLLVQRLLESDVRFTTGQPTTQVDHLGGCQFAASIGDLVERANRAANW